MGQDFSNPRDCTGVRIEGVRLVRGATTVFDGLTLELDEPRIALIGDNGAGKSSLFRMLCGLELPRLGRVSVCGHDVCAARVPGRVGMMFQNPDDQIIFPTVEEELALGLTPAGLSRREALGRARALLAARGLAAWAQRAISALSQGERQYLCWLALLLAAPRLLLLDEPYASLDLPGQARLAADIAGAPQQIIISTHVLDHVRHFERVIWLERGRVRADGAGPEICAAYEADVAARWAVPPR